MAMLKNYEVPQLAWNNASSHTERKLSVIKRIIIHHSATEDGDVESFHRYHIQHNGWYGVGYHYVIKRNGTIQQGRSLTTVGAHCSGNNADSIGICLVGNFEHQQPTAEQYESLGALIAYLKDLLHDSDLLIQLHKDLNNTACPGKYFDLSKAQPVKKPMYRVQVGAFRVKTNAVNYCKELQGKGYDAYIVESEE